MTIHKYYVYWLSKPTSKLDKASDNRGLSISGNKDTAMKYAGNMLAKNTTLKVEVEEHSIDTLTNTIRSIKTIYEKAKV